MTTRIVNIKLGEPYDIYCGRGVDPKTGQESPWQNEWTHLTHMATKAKYIVPTKAEAIWKFRKKFEADPEMQRKAKEELTGKTLGCFCRPKNGFNGLQCHCQILAAWCDGIRPEDVL